MSLCGKVKRDGKISLLQKDELQRFVGKKRENIRKIIINNEKALS